MHGDMNRVPCTAGAVVIYLCFVVCTHCTIFVILELSSNSRCLRFDYMPWNFFITGDDMINLLFHFLDEFLFLMCADPYFIVKVSEIHILYF